MIVSADQWPRASGNSFLPKLPDQHLTRPSKLQLDSDIWIKAGAVKVRMAHKLVPGYLSCARDLISAGLRLSSVKLFACGSFVLLLPGLGEKMEKKT